VLFFWFRVGGKPAAAAGGRVVWGSPLHEPRSGEALGGSTTATRMSSWRCRASGVEDDLDHAVLLVSKLGIGLWRLTQRQPMSSERLGCERVAVFCQERQDLIAPAADVRLAHA